MSSSQFRTRGALPSPSLRRRAARGTRWPIVPSSLYRSAAPLAAVHSRASDSTPTCRKRFGWSSLKATRRSASRSRQLPQPRQLHTPHWCTHSLDVSTAERTHRPPPAIARPSRTPADLISTLMFSQPSNGVIPTLNLLVYWTFPLRGLNWKEACRDVEQTQRASICDRLHVPRKA
jgi:hypothetical protein